MKQFEYKTIRIRKRGEAADILNLLGQEGWEAFGVVSLNSEVSNSFDVLLKREIVVGVGFRKPD